MKRLFVVLGVLIMFLGVVPVNAEEIAPLANNYEITDKSDYERFHKVAADTDNYYGYIKFSSSIKTNINTGLSSTYTKNATKTPSHGSTLTVTSQTDGYNTSSSSDNYYYVRWTYTAKTSSGTTIRSGQHNHKY